MAQYAIGLDYGTNSCRSLIVDLADGCELGSAVFPYPTGQQGILTDTANPHVARQHPQDYLNGCETIIREAIAQATSASPDFNTHDIIGIGVDTTGSTVIPVDASGTPIAFQDRFKHNLNAHVWLWKDHTAHAEAEQITALAKQCRPEYLAKCGGTYSSEWWWSKILHLQTIDPEVFEAAHSFVEHCDWLPAVLAGDTTPETLKRSICAAGHKAMYNEDWGGLPDKEFLAQLSPSLANLRDRLYHCAYASDTAAGYLCSEWSTRLGLPEGIAISVGAFDCHMGAVGAGVKQKTLVKVLGTSTCDITVAPTDLPDIPGLCGQVQSSVIPGTMGIEAGQSAVGDIFLWFVNQLVPEKYGSTMDEKFAAMEARIAHLGAGASGLLALDWNNGNRSVLTDVRLSGLVLGQTLHTEAHEIYQAYIEATAFGALTIIKRMEDHGLSIDEVVTTGGLPLKNATLMQIYANVLGRPMKVSMSEQTCALGAAIFGALASGHSEIKELQSNIVTYHDTVYHPDPENHAIYQKLYALYQTMHDAFGDSQWQGSLAHVMKELISIRETQRKHN
ncbi:ribulokinase [Verrucomicrobiaceae bacterium N1E253]|uniref:Ribulokinase n=1 Tax=Oceaniferula marina TaxID=2748318 RepID=A0A851GR85_9BACT|nr:ribulokinase [Oceaniferula marina]NWK57507.1 ribulokinase [Oceaniferula marina]